MATARAQVMGKIKVPPKVKTRWRTETFTHSRTVGMEDLRLDDSATRQNRVALRFDPAEPPRAAEARGLANDLDRSVDLQVVAHRHRGRGAGPQHPT